MLTFPGREITFSHLCLQYWNSQVSQPGSTPTSFVGFPTTHTRTVFGSSSGPSSATSVPSHSVSSPNEEMVSTSVV
jgi:hypothetical protein